MHLEHRETTGKIIGVYYDVYNGTGRNYPEHIFEQGMVNDLTHMQVACLRQPEYQISYKGKIIGKQRLDLFVAEEVGVELKVVPMLNRLHKAQGISYLKVIGKKVGLLLNFGSPSPEFERLYFTPAEMPLYQTEDTLKRLQGDELLWPELTHAIIGGLLEVHTEVGPGFIHRIYANAVYYELVLRGLALEARREFQVFYRNQALGGIKFNHLYVVGKVMVFPVAIQDINHISINNLKTWMQYNKTPLGIIANFHAPSLEFIVLRI